jgi:CheY-like chemotaxis protein
MSDLPIKKTYRILLAEDDHATVEFVTAALERYNFVITPANEGRKALRYLSQDSFELMLCDVMMPYVDGFKTMENARENSLPMPPVIMLTALHDQESVIRAKKLGAAGYLGKPCTAAQLLAKVKLVLRLTDEDLFDKFAHPFSINTGISNDSVILTLVGCPVKNPLVELIKVLGRVATVQNAFKGAQVKVGLDFLYAIGSFEHFKGIAAHLQKFYHISKPNIIFSGPFFEHADKELLMAFKREFTVTDS